MSEYQYYEFQTVERPLTTKEQAEIKNCPAGFNSRQPEQFLYIGPKVAKLSPAATH